MRWTVPCPAKLNLFLAVGPKDRRNYHPLRTIFQAIDLFDTLEIEIAEESTVTCDDPTVPAENTVSKTLRLLPEVAQIPPLKVHLVKRIPSQSGLGGGSSDAAGLIRAAAAISGLPIPPAETMGLAQAIGADVPFFLVGGRARAEGYGEKLTPLPDAGLEWYVVAQPEARCDTKDAFKRLDEMAYEWAGFPEGDELYNDFERVAPCESLDLIERLQIHGAYDAGLTGSGSAVFGRFRTEAAAQKARDRMESEGVKAWACRALSQRESLNVVKG